jgi:hypothetical protein
VSRRPPSAQTLLAGVRAGYGAVQLATPAWSAEQLLGGPLDPAALRVVRVLGARQLAQASLALAFPAGPWLGLGAGVDAMHALSMVGLAATGPRWRRPALVSGLMAAAFAAAGVLAARRIPGNRTFE